jgi:hypothetical protein
MIAELTRHQGNERHEESSRGTVIRAIWMSRPRRAAFARPFREPRSVVPFRVTGHGVRYAGFAVGVPARHEMQAEKP